MLFVFDKKTIPTFWMKEMNFDIDIVWITEGKIVGIEKNAHAYPAGTSDSELPKYWPSAPVNYVLEVNAGYCEKYNIEEGNEVNLPTI